MRQLRTRAVFLGSEGNMIGIMRGVWAQNTMIENVCGMKSLSSYIGVAPRCPVKRKLKN